ncbi:MAG: PaaI family thioesterase [Actinomycetia bacterium]|nr:PaaI family thioesterase [Actinomycetes bacterium]
MTLSRADQFPTAPQARVERWMRYGAWEREFFPKLLGMRVEEVRLGYARLAMDYHPRLDQPAGVVHGGVISALLDSACVPAIGSLFDEVPVMATITQTTNFVGAARGVGLVGEGWVDQQTRSMAFMRSEVLTDAGDSVATASLIFRVKG